MTDQSLHFLFSLLHLVGIIMFAGGQFWFAVLTSRSSNLDDETQNRFIVGLLPRIANFNGLGILILLVSGVWRLFIWDQPGLLLLPSLYGWMLLAKLVIYMVLVVNGMFIEHRNIGRLQERLRGAENPSQDAEFRRCWRGLKLRSRLNFALTMIIVGIGETLPFTASPG